MRRLVHSLQWTSVLLYGAKSTRLRKKEENRKGESGRPCSHNNNTDDSGTEQFNAAVEEPSPIPRMGSNVDVFLLGEEGCSDDAPRAAGAVHREGIKRIVDLALEHEA
mmetsp:Transcript_2894/g.6098  ORF Transcript_2894/g.6098 Transcript_2894/m.6098 type:complete len:108 (-) Transcript_2894:1022-1345(-)